MFDFKIISSRGVRFYTHIQDMRIPINVVIYKIGKVMGWISFYYNQEWYGSYVRIKRNDVSSIQQGFELVLGQARENLEKFKRLEDLKQNDKTP